MEYNKNTNNGTAQKILKNELLNYVFLNGGYDYVLSLAHGEKNS